MKTFEKINFASPITGGKRTILVARCEDLTDRFGASTAPESITPVHVYAYLDEMTPEVCQFINGQIDELAAREDRQVYQHIEAVLDRAPALAQIQKDVAANPGRPLVNYTGSYDMLDRLQ